MNNCAIILVYLDDPDLLEEVGHGLHGVVVSEALDEDGVVISVILVLHCGERPSDISTAVVIFSLSYTLFSVELWTKPTRKANNVFSA